jgi:putative membrane protein
MRYVPLAIAAALLAPAAVAQTTAAPEFVKEAGASDKFEIDSSKLVMGSQDPKVKQFAQQMVTDHTNSTAQIKAAAAQDGLKVPAPMLNPMQKDMIAKLKAAKGPARDQLYMQQQMQAHQMALQLHQTYAQGGDKPALKAAAAQIAPVVQNHLNMTHSGM